MTETRLKIIELIEPYMNKILSEGGHYDITALLKYIKLKYDVRLDDIGEQFYLGTKSNYFPNKPLNLYTEQEEQELLELLLKLKS